MLCLENKKNVNISKQAKSFLLVVTLLFSLSFISASEFGYNNLDKENVGSNITKYINQTYIVNNLTNESFFHNELTGLQGGSSNEYYHLNQSWYERVRDYAFSWITNSVDNLVNYFTKDEILNFNYWNDTSYGGIGNWSDDKENYLTGAEVLAFGYYNSTDFVITDYFTKSDILGFGYYNSTDFNIANYFTSAEVLAFNYYNSSDFDINDYLTSLEILGFNYYNSSDFVITDYYSKSDIDGFNYYNLTDFDISDYATNVKVDSLGNWTEDKENYYNTTEIVEINTSMKNYVDLLNETGLIRDWNDTGLIIDWNSTGLIIDWNATGYIKDWQGEIISANTSLYDWIVAQSYLTEEEKWNANYSDYLETKSNAQSWVNNYSTFLTHVTWSEATNGTLALSSVLNNGSYLNQDWLLKTEWNSTNESYYLVSNPFGYYNSTTFPDNYLLKTGDTATGDYTFDTNTLFIDSTNHRVGIGTTAPGSKLTIKDGAIEFDGTTAKLTSDDNIYFDIEATNAGGAIRLATGGFASTNTRLYISPTGNVGIGTTSPSTKLDVNGSLRSTSSTIYQATNDISGGLALYDTAGPYGGGIFREAGANGNLVLRNQGTNTIYINNGKVGIGTSSPLDLLHIKSTTDDARAIIDGATGYDAELKFAENGSVKYTIGYDDATGNFVLGTSNVDTGQKISVTSGGNVGIGTTTPDASNKLEVNGSIGIGNAADGIILQTSAGVGGIVGIGTGYSGYNDLDIRAKVGIGSQLYLKTTGNVGIGTSSPTQKLSIDNDANGGLPATSGSTQTNGSLRLLASGYSSTGLDFGIAGGTGGWIQYASRTDLSTNYPLLLNPNGGNVGIGTTSPNAKLDVNGGIKATGYNFSSAKTYYYSVSSADFTSSNPDVDDVIIASAFVSTGGYNIQYYAPIHLPHGAVITSIILYGNDPGAVDETWGLGRYPVSGASFTEMATANFNTADTTISSGTIDNQNYKYGIYTSSLDAGDIIYGGVIIYTMSEL